MKPTELSFDIVETNNCKTIGLLDTSYYAEGAEGFVLQVQPPNGYGLVELNYKQNGITVLNSNNLGVTNVSKSKYYQDLPDGLYIIKISVCPYNENWAEKKIFRTCQIWCKFYQAFLKSKKDQCSSCLSKDAEMIKKAEDYIIGAEANVVNEDFYNAAKNYEAANKILDKIFDCDC